MSEGGKKPSLESSPHGHGGDSQPRHPNMKTESKILNMLSSRQTQAQAQSAPQYQSRDVAVLEASKPDGTMRQLSLPEAPSGLSADAAVFVPQAYKTQSQVYGNYSEPSSDLSVNAPAFYAEGQEGSYMYEAEALDFYIGNNFGELTLEDPYDTCDQPFYSANYPQASIEGRFDLALKILTTNPSNVEEYLKPICATIISTNSYNNVAPNIVENLYQQCILEDNFRYIGARICQYLTSSLNIDFSKRFVNRCKVDFDRRDQLIRGSAEDKKKYQGLGMLLAEIFRNVETSGSDGTPERLSFLPKILIQTVETLLSAPEDANIKCACQLLKLSGSLIEDVVKSSPDDCIHFEALFDTLRKLMTSSKMSENAKFHVEKVVSLKENDWNTALPPQGSSNIFNPYAQNQAGGMDNYLGQDQEAVFYDQLSKDSDDSGSHLLTEEEEADFLAWQSYQLDGYKQDPGMGNEMEEAYEEFLRQQTPTTHNSYQMPPQQPDSYRYQASQQQQQPATNHQHYNMYCPPQDNHYLQQQQQQQQQHHPPPHQYVHYDQHSLQQHYPQYSQNQHQQYPQQHQHQQQHQHYQHQPPPPPSQAHQPQHHHYNNQNPPQNDSYHYHKKY